MHYGEEATGPCKSFVAASNMVVAQAKHKVEQEQAARFDSYITLAAVISSQSVASYVAASEKQGSRTN